MSKTYRVAVCGATGAVGNQMLTCLEERDFPYSELRLLASERSRGKKLMCKAKEHEVQVLGPDSFEGIDIALFSAGSVVSKDTAPAAATAGAIVIDNSKAWRMDPQVPLVVPEVNPHHLSQYKNKGIIANPNCSTIQMVVALKPLYDLSPIRRIVVSTYQAVSGSGQTGINELRQQLESLAQGKKAEAKFYPYQIAGNLLPHIASFGQNGYTEEEMKMLHETRKIMGDDSIMVSATCVRVPVEYSHSETVNVRFADKVTLEAARRALEAAPGVKLMDDLDNLVYPTPLMAAHQDATYVGRLREDISQENGLDMWVVADNIRKGAATNAVQIAETLIKDGHI